MKRIKQAFVYLTTFCVLTFALGTVTYAFGDKTLSLKDVTYKDRIYSFRGDYFNEETFDSITIGSERVRIKNKTVTGDVTIKKIVNEGVVTLEDIDIGGTLYINGGSEIYLKGVKADKVVINSEDTTVKLYVEKKSEIEKLEIITGCIIEENGLASGYVGIKNIETVKSPLTAIPVSLKYCRLDSFISNSPTVITDLGKNKIAAITANSSLRLNTNSIETETQTGSITVDETA